MKWKPRTEVPFALAVLAMGVLNAQAGSSGDWSDGRSPQELANRVGVKIHLKEVCDSGHGIASFGKGGRNGRLVIVSQEPANVSSTIIDRCDGTRDILDDETMRQEYEKGPAFDGSAGAPHHYNSWLHHYYNNTLYSYRQGRTGSYDHVSPARFANRAAAMQSKVAANHVASAMSGGKVSSVSGGRSGFFSGGGRGGA
ncbi:hypothetical protein [Geomonas ferrireducens]|uniref:hypothetical protein n=1 Tax=Geomonas ferrireducens TaxID=2570227 RepID=UPI0010A8B010|nr:hypothetical protein [Geomonas ferrireducens]